MKTDLTTWEIGPYHGALPGPMRLRLQLDGEIIVKTTVETGYLHRGLEKACERHGWSSLVVYASHLDPEQSVFGELVACMAVEELAELDVPPRAAAIRLILSELTRISGHLAYVVRMAKSVGSETVIHYVLRDREKILDLFELVTGARFSLNFLRFGGVRTDITDGFLERVLEACEMVRIRMKEYNDLFTFNYAFLKRTSGVAQLEQVLAKACGVTGPNARAAGINHDLRKDTPYLGYDQVDFQVPLGRGEGGFIGDVHDRFLQRLREIAESAEILKQMAERVPSGEYSNAGFDRNRIIPAGEAYSRIESSRGLLGCHIISDGKAVPARVQFRPPSLANFMALPMILQGIRVEDLPVVLASLDLGIAEADR